VSYGCINASSNAWHKVGAPNLFTNQWFIDSSDKISLIRKNVINTVNLRCHGHHQWQCLIFGEQLNTSMYNNL
jgi:hypothetical protein